jgi:hypothetical protein
MWATFVIQYTKLAIGFFNNADPSMMSGKEVNDKYRLKVAISAKSEFMRWYQFLTNRIDFFNKYATNGRRYS